MRIGLLRHFPVDQPFPSGWRTSAELQEWQRTYDLAATRVGDFDLGAVVWRVCLASDLPRARITAATVFKGPVEYTAMLREARFAPFGTGGLRLPVWVWHALVRMCWWTGHRAQRACRDEFRARVQAAAERLDLMSEDTLVVSHAGFLAHLGRGLQRRGFAGPGLGLARHARVYVFERAAGCRRGEAVAGR
jgi:hypothetical protein